MVPNPFKVAGQPWVVHGTVRINGRVLAKTDAAAEAGRDISSAAIEIWMRSFATRTGSFVHEQELDKSSGSADQGYYDHQLQLGATAYSSLIWQVLFIDTNAPDVDSPSGYEETVLVEFAEPILSTPS